MKSSLFDGGLCLSDERLNEEEINKKIEEKGMKWKAGETSLSELSSEEQKKRLGLIPSEEEKKAIQDQTACGHPTLKGGVCFGPHARFSGNQKSSSLRCPGSLDTSD
jgi:hypothetical protein